MRSNFSKTLIGILAVLFFAICFGDGQLFAEEVKVVFAGQSYASLYPCHCPYSPEGGVSRRATIFKNLRQKSKNVLAVEVGSFAGSGLEDQNALNLGADEFRTDIYLKALALMGTDVIFAANHDFVFGDAFFKKHAALPFVSSNRDELHPYAIKSFEKIRVGILGLTDRDNAVDPLKKNQSLSDVLEKRIKELKGKGVNFIILLSSLSSEEDKELVRKVRGISVVINGGPSFGSVNITEENGVLFLKTCWQARQLGVLTLNVTGSRVVKKEFEMIRLTSDIADDKDVAALLPLCFRKTDCMVKPGVVAQCQDPGTQKAKCDYALAPEVRLTVIRPKACRTCHVEEILDNIKKITGSLKVDYLSPNDPKAKKIIQEFKITMLPVYLFHEDFEKSESFDSFKNLLEKGKDFYWFKSTHAGVSYIVGRPAISKRLDVFLSFVDSTPALFKLLKDFSVKRPDIRLRLHYLALVSDSNEIMSKGGVPEVEEFKRCACIDENEPDKLMDYLICRSSDKSSGLWENCALQNNLDPGKIKACVLSGQGTQALLQVIKMNEELEIVKNQTFVLDNTEIFGMVQIPSLEKFEKIVCGDVHLLQGEKNKK